jgi:hypothetical protein
MEWQGRAYHLATSLTQHGPITSRGRAYLKNAVYVPLLATTLQELAGRIRIAVAAVTLDLLNNVRTETEYR